MENSTMTRAYFISLMNTKFTDAGKIYDKYSNKRFSLFGYNHHPSYKEGLEVLHLCGFGCGDLVKFYRYIPFPMWLKEYEEKDKEKSLLENTGILVDKPIIINLVVSPSRRNIDG